MDRQIGRQKYGLVKKKMEGLDEMIYIGLYGCIPRDTN